MLQFAHTQLLYLLLIIPILVVWYILIRIRAKRALKKFGDMEIIEQLMPQVSFSRPNWKFSILIIAFAFLVLALAGPRFGSKVKETKRSGIELEIALDVSNSMLAKDVAPNRLENAKLAIQSLIEKLKQDKIGLIVFAGDAYTQIPMTTDLTAAQVILSSINTGIVPKQGTAIGTAIELGMRSFTQDKSKNKAIILITDGENHEDDALSSAKDAASKGVKVFTIGIGSPQGAPIPDGSDYKRDKDGNVIMTKLDVDGLQQIAMAGKGSFQAGNIHVALGNIVKELNKMEKGEVEAQEFDEYDEQFQWAAAMALLLVFIEVFVLSRKNKWLSKVNLFRVQHKEE